MASSPRSPGALTVQVPSLSDPGVSDPGLSFRAFVALIAAIMACNALGTDSMLPALPAIGRALHVAHANDRQWIIALYMLGFGVAQLVYGPLADHLGRRRILVVSMSLFAAMSLLAALAGSFAGLLAARLLQGIAGAASRVLAVSIVRDCYRGRQMARVMSLSALVFLAVPAVAPTLGQAILTFASWRFIFLFLALFGGTVALIGGLRLRETLHPDQVRPISVRGVAQAMRLTLTNRTALGYTLATTFAWGALLGFINSVQQIVADTFHSAGRLTVLFVGVALSLAAAAWLNARVVERLGTRRVSHTAAIGFVLCALVHVAVAAGGHETLPAFAALISLELFCFGLMGANFSAMAMDPVGAIAGTASSVQGFISTCGGVLIGIVIGQAYDGTTRPLALGTLAAGIAALAVVIATERGRLFHPHHPAVA